MTALTVIAVVIGVPILLGVAYGLLVRYGVDPLGVSEI